MEDDAPVIYGLEFQVSMAEFEGRYRQCLALTSERAHLLWFQGSWASIPGFGERGRARSVAE